MRYTSDAASKQLKRLQEDYDALLQEEKSRCRTTFQLDDYRKRQEAGENFKGGFDFVSMQSNLSTLQMQIEKLKHSINVFNATTVLPKHGITIDQALVRMAFLSKRKRVLWDMRAFADAERPPHGFGVRDNSDIIICSFDQREAKTEYNKVCEELSALQQELNYVNVTISFECD